MLNTHLARSLTTALSSLALLVPSVAGAQAIYYDSFSRAGALDGSAPELGGSPWAAGPGWVLDGERATTGPREVDHALLPFVPEAGNYYILTATLAPAVSTSAAWFALGFTEGTGALDGGATTSSNFHEGGRVPGPWALIRHNGQVYTFATRTGAAMSHGFQPSGQPTRLDVCLDTREPAWRADFRVADRYARSLTFGVNPAIQYAGFGVEYTHQSGWVDELSLTAAPADADQDGVALCADNCPDTYNPDQADEDANGLGDACDGDADLDGVMDDVDNCPLTLNPEQQDTDADGVGDACDETPYASVDGVCPCETVWQSHGDYMGCVVDATDQLKRQNLLSGGEVGAIRRAAAQASCGR